jgi:hypothetical protein
MLVLRFESRINFGGAELQRFQSLPGHPRVGAQQYRI